MAYDRQLAQRIWAEIGQIPGMLEKKMFGGVGYMLDGNMACGVNGDNLIVRVGPAQHAQALARPHTHVFNMTGRPMEGWIVVEPAGFASDPEFKDWIRQGLDFSRSLPAK
jgi:TfoX/Sxy family transcriptional regulator of competence genes